MGNRRVNVCFVISQWLWPLTVKSNQELRMGLTKKKQKTHKIKTKQNKKTDGTAHKHNYSDHSFSGKLNIILQSIVKTYVIFICIYCHFISHTCALTSALSISWTNTHSLTLGTHIEKYWGRRGGRRKRFELQRLAWERRNHRKRRK